VSFVAISLCVASQRVFIVVVYFVIYSVRKLLVTPSYMHFSCLAYVLLHASPIHPPCSVSMVNRLRAGRPGFNSRQGQGFILIDTPSSSGAQPAYQPMGTLGTKAEAWS
jgi:hypothetical protein